MLAGPSLTAHIAAHYLPMPFKRSNLTSNGAVQMHACLPGGARGCWNLSCFNLYHAAACPACCRCGPEAAASAPCQAASAPHTPPCGCLVEQGGLDQSWFPAECCGSLWTQTRQSMYAPWIVASSAPTFEFHHISVPANLPQHRQAHTELTRPVMRRVYHAYLDDCPAPFTVPYAVWEARERVALHWTTNLWIYVANLPWYIQLPVIAPGVLLLIVSFGWKQRSRRAVSCSGLPTDNSRGCTWCYLHVRSVSYQHRSPFRHAIAIEAASC